MMAKGYKVIVAGLPKSGTSTLATMLRILDFDVIGPSIDIVRGENKKIEELFNQHQGFQDYPWCFEWKRYIDSEVKIVVLKREYSTWIDSFFNSYGNSGRNYLSFSYMRIEKYPENKKDFQNFYERYYKDLSEYSNRYPNKFIFLELENLEWKELCLFLSKPIPKNIFNRQVKIPHANKLNYKRKIKMNSMPYKSIKDNLRVIVGKKAYAKLRLYFLKNKDFW